MHGSMGNLGTTEQPFGPHQVIQDTQYSRNTPSFQV